MVWVYLLTYIICFGYVLLMLSYYIGWKQTPVFQIRNPLIRTKTSVILPVRNEEKYIYTLLERLSKQNFPKEKFEILVIDDFSTDKTTELIRQANIPNLKLIRLQTQGGKKGAIAEGISHASGTLIITTDADCFMNENWLSSIVAFYEEKKPKMIVAPVLLSHAPRQAFSQIIQSQEMTVLTACACASLYYNLPILCSGANLAYEKDAFFAVNGFEGVDKTATGDDVFLMQKIHDKFPSGISYLKSKDACVFTFPENSSSDALKQRKRWASKSFSYGSSYITLIAALVFFTNFLIFLSGILSAINIKFAFALILCFSAKFLVDFMLLYSASSFFSPATWINSLTVSVQEDGFYRRKGIYLFVFILASLAYPVYVTLIGFTAPFTTYSWKGRKY